MGSSVLLSDRKRAKIRNALLKREAVLRAQVRSVVQGYTNALFIHGPGGLGKSHILSSELESLVGRSWRHHTSYSTPKGLIIALAEYPEQVHVYEDCEKIYKTDVSSSILRAACGAPKQKDRWVTYETAHECLKVNFKGGIVVVSNENVGKGSGPLAAVASRFRPVLWDLNAEERMARILDMADEGWTKGERSLSPKECREVAGFLIEEMKLGEVQTPIDLRTFCEHALPAYAQCKGRNSGVRWQDIIKSKLQGMVGKIEKRGEKNNRLQMLAYTLHADGKLTTPQKLARWREATGLARAMFFRHVRSAKVDK